MIFESMTLGLCLTGLLYYYNRRYGLGNDVPLDPAGKATVWANEALGVLKTHLAQATIHELKPDAVSFAKGDTKGSIACRSGRFTLQLEGQPEQVLNHADEQVALSFEKLSDEGLLAKLAVTVPPDGAHDVGLRVSVNFTN